MYDQYTKELELKPESSIEKVLSNEVRLIVSLLSKVDDNIGGIASTINETNNLMAKIDSNLAAILKHKDVFSLAVALYGFKDLMKGFEISLDVLYSDLQDKVTQAITFSTSFDGCLLELEKSNNKSPSEELSKIIMVNKLKREVITQHIELAKNQMLKIGEIKALTLPNADVFLKSQKYFNLDSLSLEDLIEIIKQERQSCYRRIFKLAIFAFVALIICIYHFVAMSFNVVISTDVLIFLKNFPVIQFFTSLFIIISLPMSVIHIIKKDYAKACNYLLIGSIFSILTVFMMEYLSVDEMFSSLVPHSGLVISLPTSPIITIVAQIHVIILIVIGCYLTRHYNYLSNIPIDKLISLKHDSAKALK